LGIHRARRHALCCELGDKAVLGLAQDLKDEIGINEEQVGLIASAVFVLFIVRCAPAGRMKRWRAR